MATNFDMKKMHYFIFYNIYCLIKVVVNIIQNVYAEQKQSQNYILKVAYVI